MSSVWAQTGLAAITMTRSEASQPRCSKEGVKINDVHRDRTMAILPPSRVR
jgi:hypothetical protein